MMKPFPRRTMLRSSGVSIALPALECMMPSDASGMDSEQQIPRRMVAICFELSLHPPHLIPETAGPDYELPLYLQPLKDLRNDFTVISGTSHPEVDGGHAASKSWLTGAVHPGSANFQNSISIDQLAARKIGLQTRFGYLALGSGGISVSPNGVLISGNPYPWRLFEQLFIEGRPHEKARQIERLREGQSVLDTVLEAASQMKRRVSHADRRKVDEYLSSVREAERQLAKSEQWQQKPKPQIDADPPAKIQDKARIIEQSRQFYDVMFLALQTDSTRLITYSVGGSSYVPVLPGVSMNYHDLSHHGQDPEKLKQLAIVEAQQVQLFGEFLNRMKHAAEGNSNLLDRTMLLFGSHMHSGNHDNRNLPIILAGGGFRHGQHLAFDQNDNHPLANLYVTILQRLGLEIDSFATGTRTLPGLDSV